jgi:hypothetical protein
MTSGLVEPMFSNKFLPYCVCKVTELGHIESYCLLDNVRILLSSNFRFVLKSKLPGIFFLY